MCRYKVRKRLCDIIFSSIALIILLPLFLLISILILITSGKPIFYSHPRFGKDKKTFISYKFRTMHNGDHRKEYGLSNEEAITPIGRFLRITHLDEIPQLINVFKGDISLIGPRPLDLERFFYLYNKNREWANVLVVKPGITCLNQLLRYFGKFNSRIYKALKFNKRLRKRNRLLLDKYYINNQSPLLDIKILLWTIQYIFYRFLTESLIQTKKGLINFFGKIIL